MPMAMTLPPSIRPYWTTLTAEKANAPEHRAWEWNTDPFAAKKEVDNRQEKRKEKEKAKEEGEDGHGGGSSRGASASNGTGGGGRAWEGVPEVRMAPGLREHVEGTVRKVSRSRHDIFGRCSLHADDAAVPVRSAGGDTRYVCYCLDICIWYLHTSTRYRLSQDTAHNSPIPPGAHQILPIRHFGRLCPSALFLFFR
jgi:hypothetical protein